MDYKNCNYQTKDKSENGSVKALVEFIEKLRPQGRLT